jgi:Holliday junction resolvasome RuvABC endonuclease subunit
VVKLWAPRVLGLDLSLTGTGIARLGAEGVELLVTVRSGKRVGHERIEYILATIGDAQRGQHLDLIVIEGPSYGSQGGQQGHHERAGLWWLVAHSLYAHRRAYAVVAPKARAKYATGNGNDGKGVVKAAVHERYGHLATIRDDNQADALVLAAMGVDHLGGYVADVPPVNRQALRRAAWPSTPADDE